MADITCFLFHLFNQSLNIKYEASQLKQNGCDPRTMSDVTFESFETHVTKIYAETFSIFTFSDFEARMFYC